MKNKITLKEFFDSNERLAIHCNTEEKANRLLKEFDKLGKTWWTGEGYLENTCFRIYKDKTCYSNSGTYDNIKLFKGRNFKIYSFKDIIFEEQAKPKNLIPEIAKMLGVEIGEEFKIVGLSSYKHKFTNEQLNLYVGGEWTDVDNETYRQILVNNIEIQKLPNKPQLTDAERVVLENLPKEYKWMARDEDEFLFVFSDKPKNENGVFFSEKSYEEIGILRHLFQFISCGDEEPYNIQELLENNDSEI